MCSSYQDDQPVTKLSMLEYIHILKKNCDEDPGDEACHRCTLRKDHRKLLAFLEKVCRLFESITVYNP